MGHLIQIQIGPVQPFIAAARRTRDLRAGSDLLVELVREIVSELHGRGAELIFPSLAGCEPKDADGPNVILAYLPEGSPKEAAAAARLRAEKRLTDEWEAVKGKVPGADSVLARAQLGKFVEFASAWAEMNGPAEYGAARKILQRRISGRRLLRSFGAAPTSSDARPKSPLDPSFETVLPLAASGRPPKIQVDEALYLKPREALDAIGTIKRFRKDEEFEGFKSTRQIAALDVIAGNRNSAALWAVEQAVRDIPQIDVGSVLAGDFLDLRERPELERRLRERLAEVAPQLSDLRPRPYYAVLHADGDRVGKYLDSLGDMGQHQEFSKRLGGFARSVRDLFPPSGVAIASDGLCGQLVYAGGDDVVALVPARHAIRAAKAVQELFVQAMAGLPGEVPTLTVGIALVHCFEDLQEAVRIARQAEHFGKGKRNALAVIAQPRSGAPRRFRLGWNHAPETLFKEIVDAFEKESEGIPRGFPFQVRKLAEEMADLGAIEEHLVAEFERVASRREGGVPDSLRPQGSGSACSFARTPEGLRDYAEALYIGHFITRAGEGK